MMLAEGNRDATFKADLALTWPYITEVMKDYSVINQKKCFRSLAVMRAYCSVHSKPEMRGGISGQLWDEYETAYTSHVQFILSKVFLADVPEMRNLEGYKVLTAENEQSTAAAIAFFYVELGFSRKLEREKKDQPKLGARVMTAKESMTPEMNKLKKAYINQCQQKTCVLVFCLLT